MSGRKEFFLVGLLVLGLVALGLGGYFVGAAFPGIDGDVLDAALRGEYTGRGASDELSVFNNQPPRFWTSNEMSGVEHPGD